MALMSLVDQVTSRLQEKMYVAGVFIDLSKAFDTLDHVILLNKIEHYGVRGLPLSLFTSYLSNRKQAVVVRQSMSSFLNIKSGVPQGSILGPLLFLIYINDLTSISRDAFPLLFADDTNLLFYDKTPVLLSNKINTELCKFHTWFQTNKLSMNTKKTKLIVFRTSRGKSTPLQIMINNAVIQGGPKKVRRSHATQ